MFHDYPPYLYLVQVCDHCPKAAALYLELWRIRNSDNKLTIVKKTVRTEFLCSLAKIRHDLFLLLKEGLLNVDETPLQIFVELVNWEDINDSYSDGLIL